MAGAELANGLHHNSAGALEEGRGGGGDQGRCESSELDVSSSNRPMFSIPFMQKVLAEIFGTYFLIFAGCAAVAVNLRTGGTVTYPGICMVWGLAVMVMVYSVGHISGAHLNPAVSIAFATCGRFPWKQVPAYASAQTLGASAASLTLRVLFGNVREHFFGTVPAGSDVQSLVIEFIISFNLMFVVSGVATDNRAVSSQRPFPRPVLELPALRHGVVRVGGAVHAVEQEHGPLSAAAVRRKRDDALWFGAAVRELHRRARLAIYGISDDDAKLSAQLPASGTATNLIRR